MSLLRKVFALALLISGVETVHADPPNGIRAVVHDSVITADEVELSIALAAERLSQQYASRPELFQTKITELRAAKLEALLDQQLILHEFKTAGYSLPESVIDELVQEEIRAQFGDRVTATKTLQAQGLTYEKFRQQARDRFVITALRQKNITSIIIISPHKIETYYASHQDDFKVEDEVKLRMIEIRTNNPAVPNARKLAEEISRKLKDKSATFDEMARETYNSRQGKAAETYQTSHLRKELAEAASKLKAGEYSDVVDTSDACYVILVEENHPAHVKALNEVRADIEKDLTSQERARLDKQWIDRLKKKTFYRYF